MFDKDILTTILDLVNNDNDNNLDVIRDSLVEDINYVSDDGSTLLHLFVQDVSFENETKLLLILHTLLD